MKTVFDWSIAEFLERAAAATPTPGGGSVAATAGALGVAMVQMVANLTLGREECRESGPVIRALLQEAGGLRREFETLAAEDMAAFDRVMDAYRLPKATEREKELRREAVQAALRQATEIPLEVARAGLQTAGLAERLAAIGRESVLSDAGVACYLGEAAVRSALVNVGVNARLLHDRHYVERTLREKERLAAEAAAVTERVERLLGARLGISFPERKKNREW